ncbi:MAG: HNH endonuclease [Ruminococcus sp.]|nr:HNH endonuclease [Ruminococcus sp.]
MKKACPYCGKIHDSKYQCSQKPDINISRGAREDRFRWSYEWKLKREYILRRDRYLCKACLNGLPGTVRKFNNESLSVHHIIPLKSAWELRLADENLITLCRNHHEMAESGTISADTLAKILSKIPPGG